MKHLKLLALTAATLATFHLSAHAATALSRGWYLEGNVGESAALNATYIKPGYNSGSGFGWNVDGGFKFMQYIATEIGFTHYGLSHSQAYSTRFATATHYSYDAAVKGILPFPEWGAEVFAKLGLARVQTTITARNTQAAAMDGVTIYHGSLTETGYYFALGADYSFLPKLATNIQWARAKGNSRTGTLDLYSVGLTYLFG